MAQHKAELCGQTVCGNLLHCGTVQIGDNALQAQILADIGFQNDLLALLHDAVGVRGYHKNAVGLRHLCIIQCGAGLADLVIDVGGGQGHSVGLGACIRAHNAVGVCIDLRNDHLTLLAGQTLSGFQHGTGLVHVQPVDHKRKAAVFGQGVSFGHSGQGLRIAVAVASGDACAVVVVHCGGAHFIDADTVRAVKAVVLIRHKAALRFVFEKLVHLLEILFNKIDCHILKPLNKFLRA